MSELPPQEVRVGAVCARHRDQAALACCRRCGDFFGSCCATSGNGDGHCFACTVRTPELAKRWPRIASGYIDFGVVRGAVFQVIADRSARAIWTIFGLQLVVDVALLARREQTLGMWLFGTRYAQPDGNAAP